jgi:hypothetical protein
MADQPTYIEALASREPEFAGYVATIPDASRTDDEISAKHKLLTAVSVNGDKNSTYTAGSLDTAAREAGSTEGGIAETVEVVTAPLWRPRARDCSERLREQCVRPPPGLGGRPAKKPRCLHGGMADDFQ